MDGHKSYLQLIVPRQLRKAFLREAHNGVISGHLGCQRVLERLRQRCFWPGMSRDVEEWCRECDICARRKNPKPIQRAPLGYIAAGQPFERLAMDLMGPLPTSVAANKHILVVIDYFTKWAELFALPDATAETVAERLLEDVISIFGMPEYLHTDQGSQFESAVFQQLCTRTTPYHPQSDGLAERLNRTVEDMLAGYVNFHQTD